jgi:hypothetical protein
MAIHKDLTGDEAIHPAAYVASADPGAVGADKLWIDTTTTPPIIKKRNAGDAGWDVVHDPDDFATPADVAAVELGDLADVDTSGVADGDVLTYDSGSGDWLPVAPSASGGGLASPDDPPGSPNTEDDEFDSSSLDAKWTQSLTGAPSVDIDTTWPSHYMAELQAGGSKREARITQAYVPAGDFSLTAKCVGAFCETDAACVLWALNSAGTDGMLVQFRRGVSNMEVVFYTLDASAFNARVTVTVGTGESTDTMYLHMQRVGTSLQAAYSHNGRSFRHLGTHTKTYTQEIVRLTSTLEATNTVKVRAGWDWIRRDWLTLTF